MTRTTTLQASPDARQVNVSSRNKLPPRNEDGTFAASGIPIEAKRSAASGIPIEAKRKKTENRNSYSVRGQNIGRTIFDVFVNLFFLCGAAQDWIPTSKNSGPLVKLAEQLFKPTYLITQAERSKKLHLAYAGGDPKDVRSITTRITTRDADAVAGLRSRVFVFSGRRLPCIVNYTAEIEPVRNWIQDLFESGYLKLKTSEEAFSLCLDTIKSYVMVNGKRAYRGYPKIRLPPSTPRTGRNEPTSAPTTTLSDSENQSVAIREEPAQQNETVPAEERNDNLDHQISPRHSPTMREFNKALAMAHADDGFLTLGLLFDEEIKDMLEITAGAGSFLERNGSENKLKYINDVTKDMLLYSQWKTFGIKDLAEHQSREEGLRAILRVATAARAAYGLVPYSDLRQNYLLSIDCMV